MQLALVHDWLNQIGGAEDVLETLVATFPGAPVYTSMYWPEKMPPAYRTWDIRTTWMDRLPGIHRRHRPYLPLYPVAFAGLDLSGFDAVLSNKSGFCHGVRTGAAPHVCYCLAPTRYVWEFDAYMAQEAVPNTARRAIRPFIALLRRWDYRAAQRVTHFVAISRAVQKGIRLRYGRESVVIHPPVSTKGVLAPTRSRSPSPVSSGPYYLIVSRLVAYRRIDLAVAAFNRLGRRLLIAGEGPDRDRLEAMAEQNVAFLGRVPDGDLFKLFAECQAYILPGKEDFGIAPLQAQASGRPVIAYADGGALDTVIDGVTGTFFREPDASALAEAVLTFDSRQVDADACRANAARFSPSRFSDELVGFLEETVAGKIRAEP